jgi:ParB-like chromosome segregation protein Spo0J
MAQIEYLSPSALKPARRNARTHSRKQIRQIAASIERFGFTNPVLVDQRAVILAGHGRVEAAKLLAMLSVPCMRIGNMSEADKRAYALADNKLALNADWDDELLAMELQELMAADLGFDLGITGFSIAEVDRLIDRLAAVEDGDPALDARPGACSCTLPGRGCVAARGPSADLRRRTGSSGCLRSHGWRTGGDGVHRPAL